MIGIELFAGAGGMSLGATWAGVDVRVAVEISPAASRTFSRNHPGVDLITADIRDVHHIPMRPFTDEVIVFGGPPCQGFSTSNQKTRNIGNPKNWLFKEFLRIVALVSPSWVVFENVAGIMQTEGGLFVKEFESALQRMGYTTTSALLNAAEFGVPQKRMRFFMIGARDQMPPDLDSMPRSGSVPTVKDAIGDLPILPNGHSVDLLPYRFEPTSAYSALMRGDITECTGHLVTRNADHIVERYKHIPQGGNWENIPADLMESYADRSRCHTGIYRRLDNTSQSVVLGNFRKNMLVHPIEDRGLSVREAARLQSFPDEFSFCGSIGLQQQQVGNAVPPLLSKAVFQAINKNLEVAA